MNFVKSLRCIDCGREIPLEESHSTCPKCREKGLGFGILDPDYEYEKIGKIIDKKTLEKRKPSVWKYKEFLPISDESKIVSLNEGGTPLIPCENITTNSNSNLFLKNETQNPTYSFKDRAFTVIITKALESETETVASVSDGNAGSAAAAYSAKANIKCNIFSPAFTVKTKVNQMIMYGANVFSVKGNLTDTGLLVIEACEKYGWKNITTAKVLNPFQTEGHKTIAYEICEQLNWNSPDWIIAPISSGDSMGAIWKGFKEFQSLGLLDELPQMVGVQAKDADPVVKAFEEDKEFFEIEPFEPETIADAICVGRVLGSWPLKTLKESDGKAIAVSDKNILKSQKKLSEEEGLFIEPSSATTIAGFEKLAKKDDFNEEDTVVCLGTGSGLKVPKVADEITETPIEINPELEELDKHISK